jgi:cell fate regulator YaaT (PSP1 superfamily)
MDEFIDEQAAADEPATETIKLEKAFMVAKILHSSETTLCSPPEGMQLASGDYVVLSTRYGKDLGRILGPVHEFNVRVDENTGEPPLHEVVRLATEEDLKRHEDYRVKEEEAFNLCKQKILQHKLDMKLVSAHYIFVEVKILFFFTAEARVDFRELVKDLVSVFKMRIELRQIGVRDESRVMGGIGVCGRHYCCHGITDKLKPVSIIMAKVQNLSLNSMKISGPCGRLLCCLSYEFDTYNEEKKKLPNEGYKILYDDSVFKIIEINILSQKVKLLSEDGRLLEIPAGRIFYDQKIQKWQIKNLDDDPAEKTPQK